ncbi:MAG TPA: tetratricopeptide repeat protein [Verrucomicrobiae bacterium]|nr:tetratricopeptide repeat protein [Verrucomicrobiae bacterium]
MKTRPFLFATLLMFLAQTLLPIPAAHADAGLPAAAALSMPEIVDCSRDLPLMTGGEFQKLWGELEQERLQHEDPGVLLDQADALTDQERFEEAIPLYSKVLSLDPEDSDALSGRGNAYIETRQFADALRDLTKNVQLNPDSFEAWYDRGVAYFEAGDYPAALQDYQKSVTLNPSDKCAHNNLAITYESLGDNQAALSHYNQALEIDPAFEKALRNRADLYFDTGAYFHWFVDHVRLWWMGLTA